MQELRKYKENEKDTEVLMSALSAMQEKTQHLENSLSAETRIKLDLFSALGDAKRQLEIAQGSYLFVSFILLTPVIIRCEHSVENLLSSSCSSETSFDLCRQLCSFGKVQSLSTISSS